jgi:DNA (cytosine-5)-methyltransferase 1
MSNNAPAKIFPVVSLFCGPGGMDEGFRDQGFYPVLALDIDQSAVDTYNWNNKGVVARQADLMELSDSQLVRLVKDITPGVQPRGIIGGPPCQSFSISNVHHKPNDLRKKLLLRYAQALAALNREFNLDFFVFENVSGLKSKRHRRYFLRFIRALKEAGFAVFEQELNASRFGVPQERRRIFVVGINRTRYPNIQFAFPDGGLEIPITVRDAIAGLPEPAFFKRDIKREEIPHHPNHWTMNPRSPKFTNASKGNGRSFRKLKWDQPSWTVAYGHREMHVHPTGVRRVSVFEAMLLQAFPERYEIRGNLSQQVEQVSNAVPPPLASAMASAIRTSLYGRIDAIQQNLLQWFAENARCFPWRTTMDPYKVLVAEKLLQQTAATKKVVAAYETVISLYPTAEALSKAQPARLRQLIRPLGFLYRADELPRLARALLDRHAGKIPTDLSDLLRLPGVGDYSARAVLSFAYSQDIPVVDTNVARFLRRVYGITKRLSDNPARSRQLIAIASALIPEGRSREFNLAILDLSSLVCKPREPECPACPIRECCSYADHSAPSPIASLSS